MSCDSINSSSSTSNSSFVSMVIFCYNISRNKVVVGVIILMVMLVIEKVWRINSSSKSSNNSR